MVKRKVVWSVAKMERLWVGKTVVSMADLMAAQKVALKAVN